MKITVRDYVKVQPDKMAKVALATTPRAQLDVYTLAPGQSQRPHVHADQDKICYVIEGRGRFSLDGHDEVLETGHAIVARAGAAHGIVNDGPGPLVVLVVVVPPPEHA
jgi:quercetin dioxygenase-like cupin family protein